VGALIVGLIVPTLTLCGLVVRYPRIGLYLALISGFVGVGIGRYVPAPTGLLVDVALALTLIGLIAKPPSLLPVVLRSPLTVLVGFWLAYNLLQLFNPEGRSTAAWFYAGRGVFMYIALAVPAGLMLLSRSVDIRRLLSVWLAFSVLGALWGLKQKFIGLDSAELAWLSVPGNQTTHVLFGKLRVFSFFSDAGQFGAAQAHAAVVAMVLALGPCRTRRRIVLLFVALLTGYGMLISGTRGALAVPAVALVGYLVLSRNWKVLILGTMCLCAGYGLLRYTYVGQGVYEVRRMRTAVIQGTDNPSFQVRLENQRRLKEYLRSRPFGGGVGSAGYWGTRFTPGTFLADLPLDSWYVRIAAEQGPVGLVLYGVLLLYICVAGLIRVLAVPDPHQRHSLLALYVGMLGILAASYGNQVLGQMPTGIVIYFTLGLLFAPPVASDGMDSV